MVNSTAPTVLDRLTKEIRSAQGPIRLEVLARRIGVQASALPGMLGTLERKGVLTMPAESGSEDGFACSVSCGRSCEGLDACPFIADVRAPQPIVILGGHG